MGTEFFIALILPAVACVLAAALFVLSQHRSDRNIALVAWSFLGVGTGLSLLYLQPLGFAPSRFIANMLVLASIILLCHALIARRGGRTPWLSMICIAAVTMGVLFWGLVVERSLELRIWAVGFGLAAIGCMLCHALWRAGSRTLEERALLVAAVAITAVALLRPTLIYMVDGGWGREEDLFQSVYWITIVLCGVVLMSAIALVLITSVMFATFELLRKEAGTDPLSGLMNRRGFEQGATRLMRKAERYGQPVSIVLADLDHFKRVNDCYGHARGDAAIRQFAQCLLDRTQADAAVVGRLGGEEFAIIFYGATASTARLAAEAMRVCLSVTRLDGLPGDLRLSASFGVAERLKGEELTTLIDRADRALYAAKAEGRDRVRVAPGVAVNGRQSWAAS